MCYNSEEQDFGKACVVLAPRPNPHQPACYFATPDAASKQAVWDHPTLLPARPPARQPAMWKEPFVGFAGFMMFLSLRTLPVFP